MTPQEKEEVRARNPITEVVGGYTTLRASGRKFKALCPFHSEKTPSFHLDPDAGTWRCFGACGTGGDVFSFLMRAENLTFMEAAERLAERAGVSLTRQSATGDSSADAEAHRRAQEERERLWAACAVAQRLFRAALRNSSLASEYATQKRELSPATLENFGIGYAPDSWDALANALARDKVHSEDAEKAGLILPSFRNDGTFTDRFRARLMFPIFDVQERVIAFGGRILVPADNAPKYLNSPETPIFHKRRTLYGLNRARKAIAVADKVVIVEGYMDVVAAHQAGIEYVVATLGTSLTEDHMSLLRRYTQNVVVSFDADTAGQKAALRAVELFESVGQDFRPRVLMLPTGEDPDSLLRGGDLSQFLRALDGALSLPDFRLRILEAQHDLKSADGRVSYLDAALRVVARVPSLVEQDALIRKLATHHPLFASGGGLAEQSLREEAQRLQRTQARTDAQRRPSVAARADSDKPKIAGDDDASHFIVAFDRPKTATQKAEHVLLRALLSSPSTTPDVGQAEELAQMLLARPELSAALFSPVFAPLVDALLPMLQGGIPARAALDALQDPALRNSARGVLMVAGDEPMTPEVVLGCLQLLEKDRERRALRELLLSADTTGSDAEELLRLREWQERIGVLNRDDGAE